MSKPFFFRSILALTLIAGVSACQSTGMPAYEAPPSLTANQEMKVPTLMPRQKAMVPVDAIEFRDSYFAANPRGHDRDGRSACDLPGSAARRTL
ncbi:hypothetical protein SAMN05444279_13523 [Ruegeria intermedia]|uniref:Beta-barrel assembly machine subunit BamF n=1 Tax=Ruegeria intermedia TaxID=996115 RepID=A0A1M5BA34_9RHOB|nr:hypothetical protein SAMN05444279_13523 [Ruegeria intermedia]